MIVVSAPEMGNWIFEQLEASPGRAFRRNFGWTTDSKSFTS